MNATPIQTAAGYSMQDADQAWNSALHDVGCDDATGIASFMADLGKVSLVDKVIPKTTIGECSISGTLANIGTNFAPVYTVTSTTLPSAFTPSPTATPTLTTKPTASPTPTLKPTATPSARPTATARATATPAGTATATATASGSASAGETASAIATPTPAGTPEQTVAGITFTAEPTPGQPGPVGGGGGDWAGSVPDARQVSSDPAALGGSGLAALLLLLAMGFIGELFNNTFEANYDRILAWWAKSWLGRVGRAFSGLWGGGT